jgi:hypothetical protein
VGIKSGPLDAGADGAVGGQGSKFDGGDGKGNRDDGVGEKGISVRLWGDQLREVGGSRGDGSVLQRPRKELG